MILKVYRALLAAAHSRFHDVDQQVGRAAGLGWGRPAGAVSARAGAVDARGAAGVLGAGARSRSPSSAINAAPSPDCGAYWKRDGSGKAHGPVAERWRCGLRRCERVELCQLLCGAGAG